MGILLSFKGYFPTPCGQGVLKKGVVSRVHYSTASLEVKLLVRRLVKGA
jgi:hypothetical protein